MQIADAILQKWGIIGIAAFYIADKIFQWIWGSTWRWIKTVDANTRAVEKMSAQIGLLEKSNDKFQRDLQTAFLNIREIRQKEGMGPLTRPIDS